MMYGTITIFILLEHASMHTLFASTGDAHFDLQVHPAIDQQTNDLDMTILSSSLKRRVTGKVSVDL
jgi:hypothetical protein